MGSIRENSLGWKKHDGMICRCAELLCNLLQWLGHDFGLFAALFSQKFRPVFCRGASEAA